MMQESDIPNFKSNRVDGIDDIQDRMDNSTIADENHDGIGNDRLAPDHRLHELEQEQENLSCSLLALTTHIAQVQFRLKQIADADPAHKEPAHLDNDCHHCFQTLLAELQSFAFSGCPDVLEVKRQRTWHSNAIDGDCSAEHEAIMDKQRTKQMLLIKQLKDQLSDLERFAYETGDGGLPSSELMEKQKAVLDKLHEKMQLNLELDHMTSEDLQMNVDLALKQLINPMKLKDKLVQQLQTQITDLERFVEFLQGEGSATKAPAFKCSCQTDPKNCLLHNSDRMKEQTATKNTSKSKKSTSSFNLFGCNSRKFQSNELKYSDKGSHWGDIRAEFELAIDAVLTVMRKHESVPRDPQSRTLKAYDSSDNEEVDDVFDMCDEEIVTVIRKELCPTLRDLLEHGLCDQHYSSSSSMSSAFGCFPNRARPASPTTPLSIDTAANNKIEHPWDVIVRYYVLKHGREFSEAPVRKLSQSFNLDSIGGRSITSKQMLLTTIENIRTSHEKLKRSPDAMFKAFVSAALNEKKLVAWLRMILRTREIIDQCYAPWSYVARTGFEDALVLIEKVQQSHFELPIDLAVRPFRNMKDAF